MRFFYFKNEIYYLLVKVFKFYFMFFLLIITNWFSFWYECEWFLEYNEIEEWISFECDGICLIRLWERNNADFLDIDWLISWSGEFIIWSEGPEGRYYFEWDTLSESWNQSITFFNEEKTLYKIPRERGILLEFLWTITWNIQVDLISFSFVQKIERWWNDFWEIEKSLHSGIMNSRKWIVIRWTPILKYWYGIFVVSSICILIFVRRKRKQKFRMIFYVWIGLFLLLWIRNTITYTGILYQWMSWFYINDSFFDLWDFIPFMDKVRKTLNLNFDDKKFLDCKIYMESYGNREIEHHWQLYFRPCKQVYEKELADYIIYDKVDIPDEDLNKKVLVEFNGSYLLDNNKLM